MPNKIVPPIAMRNWITVKVERVNFLPQPLRRNSESTKSWYKSSSQPVNLPEHKREQSVPETTEPILPASKAALLYNDGGAAVRLTAVFASRYSMKVVTLPTS